MDKGGKIMDAKDAKKSTVYRKLGVSFVVGTTLFSVVSPLLQVVAYADGINESPSKLTAPLLPASSAVNDVSKVLSSQVLPNDSEEMTSETSVAPVVPEDSTSSDSSAPSEQPGTSDSTASSSSTNGGSNNSSSKPSSSSKPVTNPSTSTSKSTDKTKNSKDASKKETTKPSSSSKGTTSKRVNNAPIKYTRNQSTAEFIEEIGESAREIGQKNNLYASVMIAQAILESGSGNSGLSRQPNYNLFGIKGTYKGESVEMATLEDDGKGGMFTISAKFRKYPSYKESLEDYAVLMTGGTSGRSTYYQGAWKSTTQNYQEATKYLTGRYATDTRYNDKLNGLIETYGLAKYDQREVVEQTLKKSKETEQFIKDVSKDIEEVSDKHDMYASVLIAEAIIDSSSGNHVLADKYNIYQVEGNYKDKSMKVDTIKPTKSGVKLVPIDYKAYPSYKIATEDYISEIKKDDTIYKEMTRSKKDNYKKVTAYLTAQNQEDRKYHKKLNAIIHTYDLTKFDKESDKLKREKIEKEKNEKEKEKQKLESLDMLNAVGRNMTEKLSESLSKPTKYQVSQKRR